MSESSRSFLLTLPKGFSRPADDNKRNGSVKLFRTLLAIILLNNQMWKGETIDEVL